MKRNLSNYLLALTAGGLLPLSFAPFHYYPLAVISVALLFLTWRSVTAKQAAWLGFVFGLGFFGVGVSWVYVAIHDFGQASILLAGLMTAVFVSFLALFLAALGWLVKKLAPNDLSSSDFILLLPVAWLLFELFKGWFLTGFPWLELGVGQINGPLSGYTPVVGALGVSLLTALSAGLSIVAWRNKSLMAACALIVVWGGGQALKSVKWTEAIGEPIKVTIIQGNVSQEIKWDPDQFFKTLALYDARTAENWDSDLIIWPENSVPMFYHQVKEYFLDPLSKRAAENDTEILLGLPVLNQQTNQYFNSMTLLGKQADFYSKGHLVPFGEYIPFAWLRGLIAFFDLPMSSFSEGVGPSHIMHVDDIPVGLSICYEDVFSTDIRKSLPEARLLINASNNAWYGKSFAPQQHLQISQNRSLEMGRSTLRSTTNGISALIDYKGQLVETTPQFEEAVLTVNAQPRVGSTPYVKFGQWPMYLVSLLMLVVWAYYQRVAFNNKRAN
jgi:apolipoprotein N-acyltransferase